MVAKGEPEEILDEAHEQLLQRVCAIDVAKDSGKVCVRLPAESGSGRRVSKVWDVPARTKAVIELESLTGGRVGTGRGAGLTTSPFPRPARRTRRARLHAPGAPCVGVIAVGQATFRPAEFGVHGVGMVLPR